MASSQDGGPAVGGFVPQCDAEGRYLSQQVQECLGLVCSLTVEFLFMVFLNCFSATALPDTVGVLTAGDRRGQEPGRHPESHE